MAPTDEVAGCIFVLYAAKWRDGALFEDGVDWW